MSPRRALAIFSAATALTLVPAAPGQARAFHTPTFHAFKGKIGCGVQLRELGGISCFAASLPSTELDGYIELHATGDPSLGERGDSPWRTGKDTKLRKRQRWERAGVSCKLTTVLRCTNADGNGFTLTPKAYAVF
jgi:hypothetical protein